MRKRVLHIMLVLTLMFGTCRIALAADTKGDASGNGLKSHGKIAYQNGSDAVVIDSADLYTLSDRIDLFKQGVANQLGAMGTYFTTGTGVSLTTDTDIHVAHTAPSVENAVNPLNMNFDALMEGVAASQSVTADVTAYGYPEGTQLYKNADGMLTTDGTENGAEQISVTAATADNLTAGTAAWVDGRLILGTGTDNKSCMEDGYKKGLDEGASGNNVQRIDIKAGGNQCVAPENATGALVYIEGRRSAPALSFRSPDGAAVPYSVAMSRTCYEDNGLMHRNGFLYYVPKIKANTVITVADPAISAYYIYFKK